MVDTVTNIECRICKQIESHNKDSFLAIKDSKYWSVLIRNTAEPYVNDSQIGDNEGRKVFAEGIYHGSHPPGKYSTTLTYHVCRKCIDKVAQFFGDKYITFSELAKEKELMILKTNEMRKYVQLEELLELPLSKAINKLKALKKEYNE